MECPDEAAFAALVGGELSEDEARALDEHIDACAECFEILAAVAEVAAPAAAEEPPAQRFRRGAKVGRYVLEAVAGIGAMGTVYEALDPDLERRVALKIVRGPDALALEARLMAKLSHPNVMPIYDVGTEGEHVFLAMELIDGDTLTSWLEKEERSWQEIVRVFEKAARGLAAAHDAGLVHLDFKPDNVLVGRDGRVLVTDFGLARKGAGDAPGGTPWYMAPEQTRGDAVDARADQYAFSVALFEALHGHRPVDPPREREKRSVPRFVDRAVLRGASDDPAARYASMRDLADALDRSPTRMRSAVVTIAAIAAGVAIFVGLAKKASHECADAAPSQLTGVWDDGVRTSAHRAFSKSPAGEDAWKSVEQSIGDYASGWTAMRVETCDATHVRHEQSPELFDLRMTCLNERLAELRAMTTLFAAADDGVVRNAPFAAKALTPLAPCADARALRSAAAPPPQLAAKVAELRREIARAKAMRDAGRPSQAQEILARAGDDAAATGYRPVEALALLQLGDAQIAAGSGAAADTTLTRAVRAADAAKDDILRARSLTRQLYGVGFLLEQFARARELDTQAASVIERIGGDDELESDRLQAIGMVMLEERDLDGAASRLTEAIRRRERVFGPRSRRVAMSRYGLCLVRIAKDDLDAAEHECGTALDVWREALGASHPDTQLGLKFSGVVAFARGRVDEGCARIDEALSYERAALAADHPHIAVSMAALAECATTRKEDARAIALLDGAHAIFEARYGASHSKTIETLARLGRAYLDAHQEDKAKLMLERALADENEKTDPVLRAATALALGRATGKQAHLETKPACAPIRDWRCQELTSSRTTSSP